VSESLLLFPPRTLGSVTTNEKSSAGPVCDGAVLERRAIAGSQATAWISTQPVDDAWDDFLQQSPLGHFQQSSIWSSIKAGEGWQTVRVVVRQGAIILGGFQILVRSQRGLRGGLLNKGPVYCSADPELLGWLLDLVERAVRQHRIEILITQAPDDDRVLGALEDARGYAPNGLAVLHTATMCVPLGPELPALETRFRKTIQQEARQAMRRGVVIREGDIEDIPAFFQMMCITCRRQKTTPNPPTEAAVRRLWSAFHRKRLVRLTLADCDGQPTAGILAIRFGRRVTLWKKGWNERFHEKHPNTLLTAEFIHWAERQQAALCDFVAMNRRLARSILGGTTSPESAHASRDFFLLGFGSEPRLLPLGRVWFRRPLARWAYRAALPILRRKGRVEQ
jgi:Acetyltransferase (GNAT) domain/FemAB family